MLAREPRVKRLFFNGKCVDTKTNACCRDPDSTPSFWTKAHAAPGTTSLQHNKDKGSVQQQHHQQQKRRRTKTSILILATTSNHSHFFWMWTVQLVALCQKQQQKWHLLSLIKITNWFRLIVHLTCHKNKKKTFVVAVLLFVFAA